MYYRYVNPNVKRRCLSLVQARHVSTAITFTAVDRSPSIPMSTTKPLTLGKLKVQLLKSPSHLGHVTARVNRLYNEDKYSAKVLNFKDKTLFNFSVFDGHGGGLCSSYLAENLSREIEQQSVSDNIVREELIEKYRDQIDGYWKRWYKSRQDTFNMYKDFKISLENFPELAANDDLPERLLLSFLDTDYKFCELNQHDISGSTCTTALIETIYSEPGVFQPYFENYYFNRHTISQLIIGQVGDTRAILVDKNGLANCLTEEHHPSNPVEATRLRKYSTSLFMTDSFGEERFVSLANTRSFGDLKYKQLGVTAEPDIVRYIIGDKKKIKEFLTPEEIKKYTINGLGGDESFLVLLSDGITNVLTDQEVADIVMTHFDMKGHTSATPQCCAEEVVKFVEYVGGDDNCTCLVVRLNGWGKWPSIDRTGELRQSRLVNYNPRSRGGG
ncbi:Pyruvate dehydrogenase acetyl-transferring-phosphatase 2 mitochondrial [Spathaspora sp. JA1]|nr:Pyruvate dehydrogenase acetyl-transferring-phosphatase 2 mitochondrial [Spathaspora sp. JA1]